MTCKEIIVAHPSTRAGDCKKGNKKGGVVVAAMHDCNLDTQIEYLSIPGYPGYRAGSDGSVWSCKERQYDGFARPRWVLGHKWHRMKPSRRKRDGRLMCTISDANGKRTSRHVAHWVLLAFKGEPQSGQESRHLNGDCTNDAITNLDWGTHKENIRDKERHGTKLSGMQLPWTKITDEQAMEIRRIGYPARQHMLKYGIAESTVYHILHGRIHK